MRTSRKNQINQTKNNNYSMLFKLTTRTSLMLFLFFLLIFFLYIAGNYQGFLDYNQIFILKIASVEIVISGVFYFAGIIQCLLKLFFDNKSAKKPYVIFLVFYSVLFFLSIFFIFLFRTIDILSYGI